MGARMARNVPAGLEDWNVSAWADGDYVRDYSVRATLPAETVLLANFRGSLNGPVLELGPGTGRLTRVLVSLLADVTALDVSPRMAEATQANVPESKSEVGDLRDLSRFADGTFDAVVASNNVLDVLGDAERRRALAGIARVLHEEGVLLFSSHNHAHVPYLDGSIRAYLRDGVRSPRNLARTIYHSRTFARRLRNRRAGRSYETSDGGYALVNDPVHDHRLVMYHIGRDAQAAQLADAGLELVACFDVDGRPVAAGESAEQSTELHYAARRRTSAAN